MLLVTESEWSARHADSKSYDDDGNRSMLVLNPRTGGTELWPVQLVLDEHPEVRGYTLDERIRWEVARQFDDEAGYHEFTNGPDGETYGSFEVFYSADEDQTPDSAFWDEDANDRFGSGWYWWPCYQGCLPDGDPNGPFLTSNEARTDADPDWDLGLGL